MFKIGLMTLTNLFTFLACDLGNHSTQNMSIFLWNVNTIIFPIPSQTKDRTIPRPLTLHVNVIHTRPLTICFISTTMQFNSTPRGLIGNSHRWLGLGPSLENIHWAMGTKEWKVCREGVLLVKRFPSKVTQIFLGEKLTPL